MKRRTAQYDEGYKACCVGKKRSENPYDPHLASITFLFSHLDWDKGWLKAYNHQQGIWDNVHSHLQRRSNRSGS